MQTSKGLGGLSGVGDEYRKLSVWMKGTEIPGYDAAVWRRDAFGHAIRFSDYGDRNSKCGWEIDHITPTALGGSDELFNLRPLHCTNNSVLGGLLGGALGRGGFFKP